MTYNTRTILVVALFISHVRGLGVLQAAGGPLPTTTVKGLGLDRLISFTDTATKYGYLAIEHNITTRDGYILTAFNLQNEDCETRGNPVLLFPSILQSADAFIDAGPNAGIGFLLANDCRNVWVGNARGNYYARNHVFLNPDTDAAFWTPTTGYEKGTQDLRAHVDYILSKTKSEHLDFIGHGEGGQSFFILCSEIPEYNGKFGRVILLAPSTRLQHATNLFDRLVTGATDELQPVLKLLGENEFFYRGSVAQAAYQILCKIPELTAASVCESIFLLIDDFRKDSITDETLMLLSNHEPSGVSLNDLKYFSQLFQSKGTFLTPDYGSPDLNRAAYGSESPREYSLHLVTADNLLLYGASDTLVVQEDVEWLAGQTGSTTVQKVDDPKFNHYDFVYSRFIPKELYPVICDYLNS